MKRAIWSATALTDLNDLDFYSRDRSPAFAKRVGELAVAAGRRLADKPSLGPIVEDGIRKWRVRGTPYIILYRPIEAGIDIVRLTHVRRDWRPKR